MKRRACAPQIGRHEPGSSGLAAPCSGIGDAALARAQLQRARGRERARRRLRERLGEQHVRVGRADERAQRRARAVKERALRRARRRVVVRGDARAGDAADAANARPHARAVGERRVRARRERDGRELRPRVARVRLRRRALDVRVDAPRPRETARDVAAAKADGAQT